MPSQSQLVFPLLELAARNGGEIKARDAYEALATSFAVPSHVRHATVRLAGGQLCNLWERHVRFGKLKAQTSEFLFSSAPGTWRLTDEGVEAVDHATAAVCVRVFVDEVQQPIAAQIELRVGIPTVHTIRRGDARDLSWIASDSIPLVVTSIPYFDLLEYEHIDGQLADIRSYEEFVGHMTDAMRECFRVMTPGARMALNVGDVLRSRARHGTHEVLPLSADMLVNCRRVGFQALTPIIWHKLQNGRHGSRAGAVFGQPHMPRMCIKSETEHILLFKKPGDYARTTAEQREASRISREHWQKWVRPIWTDVPGARRCGDHPAPFPLEIPRRLISMFSYTGPTPDTVLDICGGRGTTAMAAMESKRSSVTVEIAPRYFQLCVDNLTRHAAGLTQSST